MEQKTVKPSTGASNNASNATDYSERRYLSVSEVSLYTGLSVRAIHRMVRAGSMKAQISTSGQYRFVLKEIQEHARQNIHEETEHKHPISISKHDSKQTIVQSDSRNMHSIPSDSVHLAITSPPYFNTKMYSDLQEDLGNIHDLDMWLMEIKRVWEEVFRVLQPGRKFFLNIMNVPIRMNKSFRTINLCGKNIEICEDIGFIFKRDIIWHKTNGVRAHFGTYPYPGGILLNNMHEFILEFEKPSKNSAKKYAHVSESEKEESKLDKDFWLSLKNSDVWLMKPEKSGENRKHAAPFPLELPTRLIKAYSYVGETVLDPFLGSGTTLVAASNTQRNGIGYELNPQFCAMESLESELLLKK